MSWQCQDTWTNNFKNLKLDATIYLQRRIGKRGTMSSSIRLTDANKWILFFILTPVLSVSFTSFILSTGQTAVAQESPEGQGQGQDTAAGTPPEELVIRRVEIWGLFYRLMIVAFVVGAVVQGTIIYISWRFRESNKKNWPRESLEGTRR
jgi:hypothetical protein